MTRYLLVDGAASGPTLVNVTGRPKAGKLSETKVAEAETTVDPKGLIVARFAKLNVIDLDGDVTVTGAVGDGQDVILSQWGHASWQPGFLPVGKGRVAEEAGYLVLRGQFFMNTIAGRETFLTLKGLAERTEYSYGFQVPLSDRGTFGGQLVRFLRKLLISEVSPVLRGAGVATGTVELSSLDPAQLGFASTAAENERQLRALQGFRRAHHPIVGWHDGQPVRLVPEGGRK